MNGRHLFAEIRTGGFKFVPVEIYYDVARVFSFTNLFIQDAMGHTDVAIGILPFPNLVDMIDSGTRFHDHCKVVRLDAIDSLYGKNFQGKFSSLYETPLSAVS